MAASLLADLGAQVTKVEFEGSPDPFEDTKDEIAFNVWAKNFNEKKQKLTMPKDDLDKASEILSKVDAAIIPPSKFFKELSKKHKDVLFIEVVGGSGKQKYLHDLNALFLTKSFRMHLEESEEISLPYLPLAGVIFAQQIALQTLAGLMAKRESNTIKVFLDQSAKEVLDKLWGEELDKSDKMRFLHNGRFPCYNIYKSSDGGYIGLAAVESRFWREFCETFKLNLSEEARFDESGKTGQKLSEMFFKYSTSELRDLIGECDICVNVFSKK